MATRTFAIAKIAGFALALVAGTAGCFDIEDDFEPWHWNRYEPFEFRDSGTAPKPDKDDVDAATSRPTPRPDHHTTDAEIAVDEDAGVDASLLDAGTSELDAEIDAAVSEEGDAEVELDAAVSEEGDAEVELDAEVSEEGDAEVELDAAIDVAENTDEKF